MKWHFLGTGQSYERVVFSVEESWLARKRGRGLASVGFVGENCQVSNHASFLVVEAEELVDSGDRDLAKPTSRCDIVTWGTADSVTEPVCSAEYPVLLGVASVGVAVPI